MALPSRREWAPDEPWPVEPEISDFWGPGASVGDPPVAPSGPPLRETPIREFSPDELQRMYEEWQREQDLTARSLRGSDPFTRDEVCRGYRRL